MVILMLPVAAVIFALVVNIIADLRQYHRMVWSRLSDHASRAALYLAGVGMLWFLGHSDPSFAGIAAKAAYAFALTEIIATYGAIRQALGTQGNDPADVLGQAVQTFPDMVDTIAPLIPQPPVQSDQLPRPPTPGPFDQLGNGPRA